MKKILILLFTTASLAGVAQQQPSFTLAEAIETAIQHNGSIKAAVYEVESQKELRKTSFDLPKTNVTLLYGQYNGFPRNDHNISVTQTIPFTAFGSQASLNRSLATSSQLKKAVTENELIYQVKSVFNQVSFIKSRHQLLLQQDSIFEGFLRSASFRYKTGEGTLLEQTTAETQRNELKNQLRQNEGDVMVLRLQLKTLLGVEILPDIHAVELTELILTNLPDTTIVKANPSLAYARQQVEIAKNQKKVESARFAPDIQLGFFSQTLIGVADLETGAIATKSDRFTGFQVGLAVPLWFVPHQARMKASEFNRKAAQRSFEYYETSVKGELQQAIQQYLKNKSSMDYYRSSALPGADLILKQSQAAFRGGDIGYTEYLLGVRNAVGIKESYQHTLRDYNQSIIYIDFLLGIK
ncbi:MAG TPA: TolC family protein [Chryseolinea sp.]|nr:TolC family protein [Chryseolinea sp.]